MLSRHTLIRVLAHSLSIIPLASLLWDMSRQRLGTDPATYLVHQLGFWGMVLLWSSLAMTPFRILLRQPFWMNARRPLGLWSFFYLSLHVSVFALAWCGLDRAVIWEEFSERLYIMLGVAAWLLMIPLVVTSPQAVRRRMGVRWVRVHRLVYVIAVLGCTHLAFAAKLEYTKPAIFGIVLIFLFLIRVKGRQAKTTSIKCAPLSLRGSKS